MPPISEINRSVPPELEAIVNRALARDRSDRYASARVLGQDLARFMFRFAQPVSGYDIATLVQATMREKENARLAQGSFIHQLIEEALFEFNPLRGNRSGLLLPAGAPLDAESFVSAESRSPAVEQESAIEDGTQEVSTHRRRVALVVLLILVGAVAWFAARTW